MSLHGPLAKRTTRSGCPQGLEHALMKGLQHARQRGRQHQGACDPVLGTRQKDSVSTKNFLSRQELLDFMSEHWSSTTGANMSRKGMLCRDRVPKQAWRVRLRQKPTRPRVATGLGLGPGWLRHKPLKTGQAVHA